MRDQSDMESQAITAIVGRATDHSSNMTLGGSGEGVRGRLGSVAVAVLTETDIVARWDHEGGGWCRSRGLWGSPMRLVVFGRRLSPGLGLTPHSGDHASL
jgi:hypothetical protein